MEGCRRSMSAGARQQTRQGYDSYYKSSVSERKKTWEWWPEGLTSRLIKIMIYDNIIL